MSAYIEINGSATRHNAQLRGHIDSVQRLVTETARLRAVIDQASQGQDWAGLGDLLGVSAGDAETIYNLFVSFQFALDSIAAPVGQYTARLG